MKNNLTKEKVFESNILGILYRIVEETFELIIVYLPRIIHIYFLNQFFDINGHLKLLDNPDQFICIHLP